MRKFNTILVLIVGLSTALLISNLPWSRNLNFAGYDFFLANTKIDQLKSDTVVIGIDDKTLDRFDDPMVFWHKYLAQVISAAADGGADVIALDIIPSISLDKLAPELDRQLIRSVRDAREKGTFVYLGFKAGVNGVMPHRKFIFTSSGIGYLNLYPDSDGKIRKQRLFLKSISGRKTLALSALAAKSKMPLSSKEMQKKAYIDFRQPMPAVLSFEQVFDWAKDKKLEEIKSSFANKIVFIGVTTSNLPDTYSVPIKLAPANTKRIPGVSILAFTTNTILSGKILRDVPAGAAWGLAVIISFISGILFLKLSPGRASVIAFLLFLTAILGAFQAFAMLWVMPLSPLLFGVFMPSMISGTYRYIVEYRQFSYLKRFFKSYVNPNVLEDIIQNPEQISFSGQHVVVTVMFADIRNFTTLSEKLNPKVVLAGLNRYFTEMTRQVIEVDGYLNQYYGDGLLAFFGAPNKLPNDGALAAVRCGIKMLESLERLNEYILFPGSDEKIKIGIGIHTGEAIVGNVGCYEKMQYSAIGDTVNLASRVEGLTKEYFKPLLISETTYDRIKNMVEARIVTNTRVKGRVQTIKLYEILSVKGD